MVVKESQRKAAKKYQLENTKSYSFQVNKKTESDIINHLEKIENKAKYIKNLIRQDINK